MKLIKKKDKPTKKSPNEMSFLDHLEELRWHILRAVIAVLVGTITFFSMGKVVFKTLIFAPKNEDFITYRILCNISEKMCINPAHITLIRTEIGEEFFVHIKASIFLGITVAMPFIIYEIWKFIKPGLYDKEKKHARGFVFFSSLLFVLGILFGYYIISPFAISFLSNYSVGDEVTVSSTLSSYVSYLTMFTMPAGILFQLPIVVYFLSKIGVITPMFLKQYRKHAYIVILLLAAIITPPDVVSQILIGIPLYILYEISIVISNRIYKKQKQELDETTVE